MTNSSKTMESNKQEVKNVLEEIPLQKNNGLVGNEMLYNAYNFSEEIPEEERVTLYLQAKKWKAELPFKGVKVLLNCHITRSTLIMIDNLILGGAEVEVSATGELAQHKDIVGILTQAGIPFYSDLEKIPTDKRNKYYHVVFDCGAALLNKVIPQVGAVELTFTKDEIYDQAAYPVITVDKSELKHTETYYGTGDGLLRALAQNLEERLKLDLEKEENSEPSLPSSPPKKQSRRADKILRHIPPETAVSYQPYLLIGYGKVGSGIAHALLNHMVKHTGATQRKMIIVDIDEKRLEQAKKDHHNIDTYVLNEKNLSHIKQIIRNDAYCVITATGVEGAVSKWFDREDFFIEDNDSPVLVNMGTPDEWGPKFKTSDILNDKKPINFMLKVPTRVLFLDPIFTALLEAGRYLLEHNMDRRLYALPNQLDSKILHQWQKFWGEQYPVDKFSSLREHNSSDTSFLTGSMSHSDPSSAMPTLTRQEAEALLKQPEEVRNRGLSNPEKPNCSASNPRLFGNKRSVSFENKEGKTPLSQTLFAEGANDPVYLANEPLHISHSSSSSFKSEGISPPSGKHAPLGSEKGGNSVDLAGQGKSQDSDAILKLLEKQSGIWEGQQQLSTMILNNPNVDNQALLDFIAQLGALNAKQHSFNLELLLCKFKQQQSNAFDQSNASTKLSSFNFFDEVNSKENPLKPESGSFVETNSHVTQPKRLGLSG